MSEKDPKDKGIEDMIDLTDEIEGLDPRVKVLEELLRNIQKNRRKLDDNREAVKKHDALQDIALRIFKAMRKGDNNAAAEIALKAKKDGFDTDELKAMCRRMRE